MSGLHQPLLQESNDEETDIRTMELSPHDHIIEVAHSRRICFLCSANKCSRQCVLISLGVSLAILSSLVVLILLGTGVLSESVDKEVSQSIKCDSSTEWSCQNQLECIPISQRCDGRREECSDLSDERGCEGGCQLSYAFHCANGDCIKKEWKCDREKDCKDGDDESGCNTCNITTDFVCRNFECLSSTKHCDGIFDCKDRSDEYGCVKMGEQSGSLQYFYKNNWTDLCYSQELSNLAGQLCAFLGQRSHFGASVQQIKRPGNSFADAVSVLAGEDNSSIAILTKPGEDCNVGVAVNCKTCGQSSKLIYAAYLVGGDGGFPISDYPWHVKLTMSNHICGGTIISEKFIITAAHCISSLTAGDIKVVYGTNKFNGDGGTTVTAIRVIVHTNYSETKFTETFSTYHNDIALIEIPQITFSNSVQPACLPSFDDIPTNWTNCFITGFGDITQHPAHNVYPTVLQQAKTRVINKAFCELLFRSFRIKIEDDWLCAGYTSGGIDSCQGDSGGPLVCQFHNRWVLIGVTSWGTTCMDTLPSMYSKVSVSLEWILNSIGANY